jgi:hypothetical protein
MMFPIVHFKQFMMKDAPFRKLGVVTCSGWMSRSFVDVMKHFI